MTRGLLAIAVCVGALAVGCNSSNSPDSHSNNTESAGTCAEPANPYEEGTGHYAGFEWAEENNPAACGDSSESFIEGCEEYERQESEYAACEAQRDR
jgi:hypothetical protein